MLLDLTFDQDLARVYIISAPFFSLPTGKSSPPLERTTLEKHFSFSVQ